MAASPMSPKEVAERFDALEKGYTRVIRLDEVMDRMAEKRRAAKEAEEAG